MGKILLIEDSVETSFIVQRALSPEEEVTICATLAEARRHLRKDDYALIILDAELPDGSGFDLLSGLREKGRPVFMLTGKSGVAEQVLGYSLGAEDYIVKPFSPIVLQAKVRARLRRIQAAPGNARTGTLAAGDIRLESESQRVFIESGGGAATREVALTTTEFRLLAHFMRHPDHVLSRDRLIEVVWGPSTHVLDRTVDTHISHLRAKLSSRRCLIEPVPREGYRFVVKSPS